MKPLLPIRRPRVGVGFGPQGISCVEVAESWRRVRTVRRVDQTALEPSVYCPSSTSLNVADVGAVTKAVSDLVGARGDRAVAVTLPDSCGHLGLFEFDAFPAQKEEREALLRFRFHKDLNVALTAGTRLSYQIVPAGPTGPASNVSVLAAAVRPDILAQYVAVCEGANLLAVWLGFGALQLLDYCSTALRAAESAYLVHRTDDSLAFIALRHGRPRFLRVRPVRTPPADCTDELIGTIQFYREQLHLGVERTAHAAPMVFIGSGAAQPTLREAALAGLGIMLQRELPVTEERLQSVEPWDDPLPGAAEVLPAAGWSTPVLAGLLTC